MRLPRLRLRLRMLLVLVAVAALALGKWRTWEAWRRREAYCLSRAGVYETLAQRLLARAERDAAFSRSGRAGVGRMRSEGHRLYKYRVQVIQDAVEERARRATRARAEAERSGEMAERYRHVARYPWLPLPREAE